MDSKSSISNFLRFLESKKKNREKMKIGKNRKIEISMEIFYRSPPKTKISLIFRSKFSTFCSLIITSAKIIYIVTFIYKYFIKVITKLKYKCIKIHILFYVIELIIILTSNARFKKMNIKCIIKN